MAFYYDHLDENGNIVESKVRLLPSTPALPAGHSWRKWQPSLSDVKQKKRGTINATRSSQRTAAVTVEVNGTPYTWQADEGSQQLILASIVLAVVGVAPVPPVWRTADNIDVSITLTDLQNIAKAMYIQTGNAFTKSWILKSQVESAQTIEDVENIIW